MDPTAPLLEIDHATVVRDRHALLDRLSLRIEAGQHTAILGPNGSGKSTLVKLIERRIYPLVHDDGKPVLRVFGRERWNVVELRSLLGVVSSDLRREFEGMTQNALDAVLSGFFASLTLGLDHEVTDTMRREALDALHRVDAAHLADRDVATLSTGEARRVLIARALVHRPRALLLDEPCAGLDPGTRRRFLDHLRRLAQEGTTLILVTHHIEEIVPEIGHVVMLRDGALFDQGPKERLLRDECLSALFDWDIAVETDDDFYAARLR
ncbi:iron complex transport system ATP-binding protein [Luteibacter rhizovicinus]|uniref:Iron complex transport system ATP-binding protein n=1 Tax=Luteibacter rhizovicinus TaxID=242606 RepID=A0A4R3YUM0_9GAMM|nr:ATP-binding cassette domain-containing protein [Luteibacter rhizovicinus]TCV96162.1 iron complex transport system ATP-binding protein [Luteibacter rhizovicinus]